MKPCVALLREFIATPSVNPMGRSDIPVELTGERRYAEDVRERLRALVMTRPQRKAGRCKSPCPPWMTL